VGRSVSNFFISLDGVVEAPDQWHFPYFDENMAAAVGRGQESTQAFLMGRTLYDEWSRYWPAQPQDEPFSRFINTVPQYVVSSTLTSAEWQDTAVVSGDVATQLADLRARTDGTIGISGSATLVRWLLAHDLLDALNLLVHPIAVGHGQRLFEDTPTHRLRLVRQRAFPTGVLDLTYAPAAD